MALRYCTLVLLCLLLAGCGMAGRRVVVDAGPSWLRPWQRPYAVDGQRYVPLQTAAGFREEGLASWYGAEEHGGPTSNGERFDMYRLSAAHKILPLGCRVRVTNRLNGRQLVVRVNDRGPFIPGRVVDLSYQAAKELDMLAAGVTPVTIEAVMDGDAAGSVAAAGDVVGSYAVQVAAYGDRRVADQAVARLTAQRLPAAVQTAQTSAGRMYRVRTGTFRSRSEAESVRLSLAGRGYPDAFVVME